ncbi:tRNA pseudouridine(38-40) synthase TruA [Mycoplasmoides pneumoniae]|uniref:tRNA pseudouridine(38-40) synthase TruA n=1 Tax=Mycoplasmoides pneumoniae TaxID=2104 RepID=UPI0006BA37CC|nr:tRNA pseudouridine(38-40) synthase TruA [Mycoplasmoides pneumoniae]
MPRYLAIVAYNGAPFRGWAKQPGYHTVQGQIEQNLALIYQTPINIYGSGRTDKGVHAINQTFHVDLPDKLPLKQLIAKLNQLNYPDIFVKSLVPVAPRFHARFAVKTKVYEYLINTRAFNPAQYHTVWQYNHPLDLAQLEADTTLFLGRKDFWSFSTASQKDTQRTISKIIVQQDHTGTVKLTFFGNGFLRNQIRMMVASLVALNNRTLMRETVQQLFDQPQKGGCKVKAPTCGLYLKTVLYE